MGEGGGDSSGQISQVELYVMCAQGPALGELLKLYSTSIRANSDLSERRESIAGEGWVVLVRRQEMLAACSSLLPLMSLQTPGWRVSRGNGAFCRRVYLPHAGEKEFALTEPKGP